jgi:hypothetical protein
MDIDEAEAAQQGAANDRPGTARPAAGNAGRGQGQRQRRRRIAGMTVRRSWPNVVLPIVGVIFILSVLVVAPGENRQLIFFASLVAMA